MEKPPCKLQQTTPLIFNVRRLCVTRVLPQRKERESGKTKRTQTALFSLHYTKKASPRPQLEQTVLPPLIKPFDSSSTPFEVTLTGAYQGCERSGTHMKLTCARLRFSTHIDTHVYETPWIIIFTKVRF